MIFPATPERPIRCFCDGFPSRRGTGRGSKVESAARELLSASVPDSQKDSDLADTPTRLARHPCVGRLFNLLVTFDARSPTPLASPGSNSGNRAQQALAEHAALTTP